MNKVLLISEETLKTYSLVNDNIDGKYLLPAIQSAQDIDLETLIGKALLDKLCSLVENGGISENTNYRVLLDDYITPYMVWQVMSNLQIGINYKLSNSGVISNEDAEIAGAFTDKISALKKAFQSLQFELAKVFLPTLETIVTTFKCWNHFICHSCNNSF